MLKVRGLKEMNNAEIIAKIFRYGIIMSDELGTKADEKNLKKLLNELERRSVIDSAESLYSVISK